MKHPFLFFLAFTLSGAFSSVWAATETFPSGLMKFFQGNRHFSGDRFTDTPAGNRAIAQHFLAETFPSLGEKFDWDVVGEIPDGTHTHLTFQWRYQGRPVLDHLARVHISRTGSVELASSSLPAGFSLPLDSELSARQAKVWEEKIYREWIKKLGRFKGRVRADPVVWLDPKTLQAFPALDIHLTIDHPWKIRHYVIEEESGRVLETKNVARKASASVKVFKKSPFNSASPDSVTLTDLKDLSSLRNDLVWVRREKVVGSSYATLDVEPQDYTGAGFNNSPTPSQYDYTCSGNNSACANMSFDAVNVYYHLSNYRQRVNSYFSQLGASVSFPYDAPFNVLINPMSLGTDLGDSNNALFVGEPCRSDGSMERCLVFLRPDDLTTKAAQANCNASSARFYDLAREAVVVAHEYQHYVTDTLTHIAFTSGYPKRVGDAIHEGYSDYLAASYISELTGTDVTLVGEYALSECTPLQRQLNTLHVYDDANSDNADEHIAGLSWASAFWKLRTEYGVAVADLLALKSLFFMSAAPGFIESVEAIVKADQAVYGGVHVDRIRTLFYETVNLTGGGPVPSNSGVDLGLKGCAATHLSGAESPLSSLFFLSWLGMTVFFGRVSSRRKAS